MFKRRGGFTLIEIMIVILIIAILLAIAIPNFLKGRERSRGATCRANLRMVVTAKEQWAMDNRKSGSDVPTAEDLVTSYIKGASGVMPECPSNGTYSLGNVNTWPVCSIGTNETADQVDDHVYAESGG